MGHYFFLSSGAHVLLLAAWIVSGAVFAKPRMGYYAIDLGGSMPAGGPSKGESIEQETPEAPASKAPPAPPAPKQVEERKLPANEVIRIKGKAKIAQPKPVPERKRGINLKAALGAMEGKKMGAGTGSQAGRGSGAGAGAGVIGDAGPAFPYPWYLKAIADRLNDKWKPPDQFQSDTMCQVAFTISRDGQVSDTHIEKPSGDSVFDQLALRAILASQLPPLPEGFPDSTLTVHMKFVGKSY